MAARRWQNGTEWNGMYTPENKHGHPKCWFGKGNSLKKWQFLVSMLVFGGVDDLRIVVKTPLDDIQIWILMGHSYHPCQVLPLMQSAHLRCRKRVFTSFSAKPKTAAVRPVSGGPFFFVDGKGTPDGSDTNLLGGLGGTKKSTGRRFFRNFFLATEKVLEISR